MQRGYRAQVINLVPGYSVAVIPRYVSLNNAAYVCGGNVPIRLNWIITHVLMQIVKLSELCINGDKCK